MPGCMGGMSRFIRIARRRVLLVANAAMGKRGAGAMWRCKLSRKGWLANGVRVPLLGRDVWTYRDDTALRLKMGQDGRERPKGAWVRQIILHTTKGIPYHKDPRPQKIIPGKGRPSSRGAGLVKMWSRDGKYSGAHFLVDHDGTVYQFADAASEMTYHATTVNIRSIGIEMYQGPAAELYTEQLEATADLVDSLTAHFRIQRQMPDQYRGPINRLANGGKDCVGVFGHRDQTSNRGAGDPGRAIMDVLAERGYEKFNFASGEDLSVWINRQHKLGIYQGSIDGIPGPHTCEALRRIGYGFGLYVMGPPL